ncbi:MAG TPA: 3-dehydroquinate synthase [Streptosporangiales bacterium]
MNAGATRIAVAGESPYDVVVGHGVVTEVTRLLGAGVRQVAVISTATVRPCADRVVEALADAGLRTCRIEIPDAEGGKDISVAAMCWARMGDLGFTRTDCVVSVGGGAVTDLAGFVASVWLRGVRVVHVPTTLLGMVDAAVGGKTGINTSAGKNLVGTFHPPGGVLCDLDTLAGLPGDEYVAGMAEVVKAGFIADPAILDLVEDDPVAAARPDGPHVQELVERAVRMKAAVVATDLREAGPREALNYGHTLGHAIERVERYQWRHGHAVSVGMVYAAELGRLAGAIDDVVAKRHSSILASLGLPIRYRAEAWPALLEAMRVDKKSRGAALRFVILSGLGETTMLEDPDPEILEEAYAAVAR